MAISTAASLEELKIELQSMVDVVFARTPEDVRFSVDKAYQEVAAPSDQQVTHVLTVPLLATVTEKEVQSTLREVLAQMGREATVQGTW